MNFNFKEALETLEYSQIIERKAEDFLKYIISRLKEMNIVFNDIGEMYFSVMEIDEWFSKEYHFNVLYKSKTKRIYDTISSNYYKVYNREEAISIITAIENKLKNEGLDCIDTTEETGKITVLKSIKIKF